MLLAFFTLQAQTPLSMNGKLKLVGNQLSNECGNAVQLRGISTHGPMWFQNCYTESSVQAIAQDWGADILRLGMYTQPPSNDGYISDPTRWDAWIDQMVNLTEKYGMYVIIDWHILNDNDPWDNISSARTFFTKMSQKYANKKHVIYEICNEPNGWDVDWARIKSYAEDIIPRIRANDPDNIIVVGTREWSSKPGDVYSNPLAQNLRHNVMYTFHFYAGSHFDYNYLKNAAGQLPIFVTEWGTTHASGNGSYNESSSNEWLKVLNGANDGGQLISSCNWSFGDKNETSAALLPGSCQQQNWNNRTTSGNFAYNYISQPDNFTQCTSTADDDGDGVVNSSDLCANTPQGTAVDADGCPIGSQDDADNDGVIDAEDECPGTSATALVNAYGCDASNGFLSTACYGFNNYKEFVRDDFSKDYENVYWWKTPSENDPVYSTTRSGGKLIISATAADPGYSTMGLSFGETTSGDVTLDASRNASLKMTVKATPSGAYSSNAIIIDFQIQDIYGNQLSTDALQNLHRISVPINTSTDINISFDGGYLESWDAGVCGAGNTPCYDNTFDFTKVKQIMFWINPGAGASWSEPEFTGTVEIDNFSFGFDGDAGACTTLRDDDQDGVVNGTDKCPGTPVGAAVNSSGCSAGTGADADNDGVTDSQDACPGTPSNETANSNGCSPSQLDSDNDGVTNDKDQCANTPSGAIVDATGCEANGIRDLKATGIHIYPVPASEILNVSQENFTYDAVTITTLTGRLVKTLELNDSNETLDVSDLENGVYIFKFSAAERTSFLKVVVD